MIRARGKRGRQANVEAGVVGSRHLPISASRPECAVGDQNLKRGARLERVSAAEARRYSSIGPAVSGCHVEAQLNLPGRWLRRETGECVRDRQFEKQRSQANKDRERTRVKILANR